MSKTVFIIDAEPFKSRTPDTPVESFIYERELVGENEHSYLIKGVLAKEPVEYARECYKAFDTREEALIHLDRVVTDMTQELEEQTNKLYQFINAIDDEIRKDNAASS